MSGPRRDPDLVRAYVRTRGRSRPTRELDLVTLVVGGGETGPGEGPPPPPGRVYSSPPPKTPGPPPFPPAAPRRSSVVRVLRHRDAAAAGDVADGVGLDHAEG
ncbi:DUF742 domain-containing protein, partial [Nocardia cyriacigeorgica]|uniref:DUF742 domain-containing protein n=1 Tax=Nocardia cyriacigeorgica TaxID=135487 RepID=UPI0024571C00